MEDDGPSISWVVFKRKKNQAVETDSLQDTASDGAQKIKTRLRVQRRRMPKVLVQSQEASGNTVDGSNCHRLLQSGHGRVKN